MAENSNVIRAKHSYWGIVSTASQLPNVAGAAIQEWKLQPGDICFVSADQSLYVCKTVPARGLTPYSTGATWEAVGGAVDCADIFDCMGIPHTAGVPDCPAAVLPQPVALFGYTQAGAVCSLGPVALPTQRTCDEVLDNCIQPLIPGVDSTGASKLNCAVIQADAAVPVSVDATLYNLTAEVDSVAGTCRFRYDEKVALHPDPMTRAQLLAIRNAGNLDPQCHYIITDYNRGTVGPATIMLHAVDGSTLSMRAEVKTTFDTIAWAAIYDIDYSAGRILEMWDNLANHVRSDTGDEIETFPWGNALVTGNIFHDFDFNYTGGTVRDNVGTPTSRLDVSGTAVVIDSEFSGSSYTRAGGTSLIDNCEITSFARPVLNDDATLKETVIDSYGRVTIGGTVTLERSSVRAYSSVSVASGSLRFVNTRYDAASVVTAAGATGRIDNSSSDRGYTDLRNATNVNIDDLHITSYGRCLGPGTDLLTILRCSAQNYGYFQVTATATRGIIQYSHADTYGYLSVTGGTYTMDRVVLESSGRITHASSGTNRSLQCNLEGSSYIQHTGTCTGNLAQKMDMSGASYLRFLVAATNNRAFESTAKSHGRIDFNNNVVDCAFLQSHVKNYGYAYFSNDADNCDMDSCNATNRGYLRFRGTCADGRMYRCNSQSVFDVVSSNNVALTANVGITPSSITIRGGSNGMRLQGVGAYEGGLIVVEQASAGILRRLNVNSQGYVRVRTMAATGILQYSQFTSYYYYYLTGCTASKSGMFAAGRLTTTEPNPTVASTGTALQNF